MTAEKPSPFVPRLRFTEFRDAPEWVQTPLGDAFKTITNGHANAQDHQDDGAYPLFDRSEVVKRSTSFLFDAEAVILPGEGMRLQPRYFNGKFDLHQRAYALMEPTLDSRFAFHALDKFKGALADSAVQSTVLSLRMPIIEKFAIPVPPTEAEQQKIADCLRSLDDLIAAEGRKLEALRQHKQGLMQQLFPQPGETVPRLRFPEFADAGPWEQLTIDEAADLKNGYTFKSDTYVESGDFQIVTIGNVQEGRLDLESTKSIATLPRDIQTHQILKPADILVSMTGNVGRVCLVPVEGLLLNQRVGKLVPRRIDHDFFYQMLNRNKFRSAMQLAAAGGAQGNVSAGEIKSFVFARPVDPKEQRRIADCLSTLDTQIAARVRKLDALRQHKQGLLQQLFPRWRAIES